MRTYLQTRYGNLNRSSIDINLFTPSNSLQVSMNCCMLSVRNCFRKKANLYAKSRESGLRYEELDSLAEFFRLAYLGRRLRQDLFSERKLCWLPRLKYLQFNLNADFHFTFCQECKFQSWHLLYGEKFKITSAEVFSYVDNEWLCDRHIKIKYKM